MPIEFPQVTRCCFCVPLKTACLLIGYFSIVASCLTIAATSFYTYRVVNYVRNSTEHPDPQRPPEDIQKVALGLYISFGYYMLVFSYNFVINLLMVVGVHKNKPKFLMWYINTAYLLVVLAIALVVLTFVFMGFIATIPMLKWAVTLILCIIVVRSTYLEMEEANKPKTFEMQNLYTPQRAPMIV